MTESQDVGSKLNKLSLSEKEELLAWIMTKLPSTSTPLDQLLERSILKAQDSGSSDAQVRPENKELLEEVIALLRTVFDFSQTNKFEALTLSCSPEEAVRRSLGRLIHTTAEKKLELMEYDKMKAEVDKKAEEVMGFCAEIRGETKALEREREEMEATLLEKEGNMEYVLDVMREKLRAVKEQHSALPTPVDLDAMNENLWVLEELKKKDAALTSRLNEVSLGEQLPYNVTAAQVKLDERKAFLQSLEEEIHFLSEAINNA